VTWRIKTSQSLYVFNCRQLIKLMMTCHKILKFKDENEFCKRFVGIFAFTFPLWLRPSRFWISRALDHACLTKWTSHSCSGGDATSVTIYESHGVRPNARCLAMDKISGLLGKHNTAACCSLLPRKNKLIV